MDYIHFIASNVLVILTAWFIAESLFVNLHKFHRIFFAVAGYGLCVNLVILFLGLAGRLSNYSVLLVAIILACASFFWHRRQSRKQEPMATDFTCVKEESLLPYFAIMLWTGGFLVLVLHFLRFGTAVFSDDLAYHSMLVYFWLFDPDFLGMATFADYYPANTELLSAWFVLPFKNEAWAGLGGIYYVILLTTAFVSLEKSTGAKAGSGLLLASPFVISGSIVWNVRTFAATDIGLIAMLLTALAGLALVASRDSGKVIYPAMVYAGLACGFMAGAKVSIIPVIPVIGSICLIFVWRVHGWKTVIQLGLLFSTGIFALGSFYYFRNWIVAGNPVFPGEAGPFTGPIQSDNLLPTKIITHIKEASFSLGIWRQIFLQYLNIPYSIGLVCLLGYLLAMVRVLQKDNAPIAFLRIACLSAGLLFFAIHLFLPWSAGGVVVDGQLDLWPRYIFPTVVCGLALYLLNLRPGGGLPSALYLLACLACFVAWPEFKRSFLLGTSVGISFAVALFYLSKWNRVPRITMPRIAGASLLVFSGLALYTPIQKDKTDNRFFDFGTDSKPVASLWRALEELPPASTLTFFAKNYWHFRPYFGRNFQFTVIPFHANGTLRRPAHVEFKEAPLPGVVRYAPAGMGASELLRKFRANNIDFVVSTKWNGSEDWPMVQNLLNEMDMDLEIIFDDAYSRIYRVKDEEDATTIR